MGKGARQQLALIESATFRCSRCNGQMALAGITRDWGGAVVYLSPCKCKETMTTSEMRRAARDAANDELILALRSEVEGRKEMDAQDRAQAAADAIADDEQRWGESRTDEEEQP